MIKYLELTAPEDSLFRQAKILDVLIAEGDDVAKGAALFRVASGSKEVDLPASMSGKIVEIIVDVGENISLMTPLLLLETEVEKGSAPYSQENPPAAEAVDQLAGEDVSESADKGAGADTDEKTLADESKSAQATPESGKANEDDQQPVAKTAEATKKTSVYSQPKASKSAEKHQQQSLNLDGADDHTEPQAMPQAKPQAMPQSSASEKPDAGDDRQDAKVQKNAKAVAGAAGSAEADKEQNEEPNRSTEKHTSNDMSETTITVPDIGADSAKVIEIFVNEGDSIELDDPILTLESDKASMDVPCTVAGVVASVVVNLDQDVAEGDALITVKTEAAGDSAASEDEASSPPEGTEEDADDGVSAASQDAQESATPSASTANSASETVVDVTIPDIGGDSAKVIEIFIAVGDSIAVDEPLVTLESDKASMDVPSTVDGVIESLEVSLDQEVSEGTLVVRVRTAGDPAAEKTSAAQPSADQAADASQAPASASASASAPAPAPAPAKSADANTAPIPRGSSDSKSHASPSVRRFARELGADLSKISGSGRKGRILKDDVKAFVKGVLTSSSGGSAQANSGGAGIPEVPAVDFSKFGEVEVQPLNKIKRLTAANLHRSWLNVPHVTHNDESNISDLESFRKQLNEEYKKQGKDIKLSPLAFIVKAVVNALQEYPQFNASLEPGGENLILKKYYHVGIAVDTPNGLVVPVIRDADKKSVAEVAREMGELAAKARDKKLTPSDMSGACFTISSLGGIGGTGFTPIVNAPEVAILGVSRSKISPVWNGSEFEPGMMLPLSLSYDHRVIDGAEAARFTARIAAVLQDVRRLSV